MPDLYEELKVATFAVRQPHLDRLRALGADMMAIAEMGQHFHPFGVARVVDAGDGLFVPSSEGEPWVILPVYEDAELLDLVAFPTSSPDHWLLRTGRGLALGLFDGWEPHRWADCVPVHQSPLDWLRAGGDGLCVVDWSAPEVIWLNDLARLSVASAALATQLRNALTRPVRAVPITLDREIPLAA